MECVTPPSYYSVSGGLARHFLVVLLVSLIICENERVNDCRQFLVAACGLGVSHTYWMVVLSHEVRFQDPALVSPGACGPALILIACTA